MHSAGEDSHLKDFHDCGGAAFRHGAGMPAAPTLDHLRRHALPLLWREQVIGWGNLAVVQGGAGAQLQAQFGYVAGQPPREAAFHAALDEELARMRAFLGV
jgi:hypothetical protein